MSLFIDVHKGVQGLQASRLEEEVRKGSAVAERYGVQLRNLWFNELEGTIVCLCEAPSRDAAIAAHREAGGSEPDEIFEVREGSIH
jgi:hypothetical protein